VIEQAPRILNRVASAATADLFRALHESHGVTLLEATQLDRLEGESGRLIGARLADGRFIAADLAVVGIGVRPADDLASAAGLAIDNGIAVDGAGRSSDPDILAFGDCASFPYGDGRLRLESVPNAIEQAEAAAACLMGSVETYRPRPWFWSDQFDAKLQIAGLNLGYDDTLLQAGPRPGSHAVWYFRAGRMIAVDALNHAAAFVAAKRLLEGGRPVSRQDIETRPLKELLG